MNLSGSCATLESGAPPRGTLDRKWAALVETLLKRE